MNFLYKLVPLIMLKMLKILKILKILNYLHLINLTISKNDIYLYFDTIIYDLFTYSHNLFIF
jgi:hypothetical protein